MREANLSMMRMVSKASVPVRMLPDRRLIIQSCTTRIAAIVPANVNHEVITPSETSLWLVEEGEFSFLPQFAVPRLFHDDHLLESDGSLAIVSYRVKIIPAAMFVHFTFVVIAAVLIEIDWRALCLARGSLKLGKRTGHAHKEKANSKTKSPQHVGSPARRYRFYSPINSMQWSISARSHHERSGRQWVDRVIRNRLCSTGVP